MIQNVELIVEIMVMCVYLNIVVLRKATIFFIVGLNVVAVASTTNDDVKNTKMEMAMMNGRYFMCIYFKIYFLGEKTLGVLKPEKTMFLF